MTRHILNRTELHDPDTWVKFTKDKCEDCYSGCCTMPVEVKIGDLIRMGVVDEFERNEPAKNIAKRLMKAKIIEHFNFKHEIYTLYRRGTRDCTFLDEKTRLCTIYDKRPNTCRNHPTIGPKPGFCAYIRFF